MSGKYDDLVAEMRRLGIVELADEERGLHLVLTEPPPAAVNAAGMTEQELREFRKAPSCPCGHPVFEHNDEGYCLNGCHPADCMETQHDHDPLN